MKNTEISIRTIPHIENVSKGSENRTTLNKVAAAGSSMESADAVPTGRFLNESV